MKKLLGIAGLVLAGCSTTTSFYDAASYRAIIHKKDGSNSQYNYDRINRYELIIDTEVTPYNKARNLYLDKKLHPLVEDGAEIEVGGREIMEEKNFLGKVVGTTYRLLIDTAGYEIDKIKYPPAIKYATFTRTDTLHEETGKIMPKRDTLWFDGKRSYKPAKPQAPVKIHKIVF